MLEVERARPWRRRFRSRRSVRRCGRCDRRRGWRRRPRSVDTCGIVEGPVGTRGIAALLGRARCFAATLAPTATTASPRATPAALAAFAFRASTRLATLSLAGRLAFTALLGLPLIRSRLLHWFAALRLGLRLSLRLSLPLRLAIGSSITLSAALRLRLVRSTAALVTALLAALRVPPFVATSGGTIIAIGALLTALFATPCVASTLVPSAPRVAIV